MYVLIIEHGPCADENEYFGPFDTERQILPYIDRLMAERGEPFDIYCIMPLGSPT